MIMGLPIDSFLLTIVFPLLIVAIMFIAAFRDGGREPGPHDDQ